MSAGVPAVGLAYDQRVRALLAEADHPELVLDVEAAGLAAALTATLDRLAEQRVALHESFLGFADRQRDVQAAMGRRVAAYLAQALS